jgi:hypothetical protein
MAQTLNILSLDFSSPVVKATVVAVNGNNLTVLERHQVEVKDPIFATSESSKENEPKTEDQGSIPTPPPLRELPTEVANLISEIKTPWRSSVVSIPYSQGLSLNLSLPFKDPKQIQRVLPLEVQDLIPFEVADFHMATTLASAANEDDLGCEVRVDLTNKSGLKWLLGRLENFGVDPRVVSFPSASIATLLKLAPTFFAPNCAILCSSGSGVTVVAVANGTPRASRNLPAPLNDTETAETLKEARLFLGHIERKYDITLERIYLMGNIFNPYQVKEIIGREFEFLNVGEFLKGEQESPESDVGPLLAYQAALPHSLTQANFRTGEFQFRPKLKELIAGLKTLIPFAAFFIACFLTAIASTYLSNQNKITNLEESLRARIAKSIPGFSAPRGQEISAITGKIAEVENHLKEVGSLSALSPLEAFLAVSEDLPDNLGINVTEIAIKETRVVIKGTAPDYGTLDKMERALKEKKDKYCDIDPGDSSSSNRGGNVGFQFSLTLC